MAYTWLLHKSTVRLFRHKESEGEQTLKRVWHQETKIRSPYVFVDLQMCVCVFSWWFPVTGCPTFQRGKAFLGEDAPEAEWQEVVIWTERQCLRSSFTENTHAHTHTGKGKWGYDLVSVCVMGHCLHHIHFPLASRWFPFRNTEKKERGAQYF